MFIKRVFTCILSSPPLFSMGFPKRGSRGGLLFEFPACMWHYMTIYIHTKVFACWQTSGWTSLSLLYTRCNKNSYKHRWVNRKCIIIMAIRMSKVPQQSVRVYYGFKVGWVSILLCNIWVKVQRTHTLLYLHVSSLLLFQFLWSECCAEVNLTTHAYIARVYTN